MTAKAWNCRWHTEAVFKLTRPAVAAIEQQIAAARHLEVDGPGILLLPHGLKLIFYTTVSEVIDYQRVAVLETA